MAFTSTNHLFFEVNPHFHLRGMMVKVCASCIFNTKEKNNFDIKPKLTLNTFALFIPELIQ